MSYNYDVDPWGDTPYDNQGQNVQPTGNYSNSGYSNPMSQYAGTYGAQTDDYGAGQQQLYGGNQNQLLQATDQSHQESIEQQQQQQQQTEYGESNPESGFKRFLRAHVPMCGTLMDVSSGICTPIWDVVFKYVNKDLLVSKIFYFFFYSAFGSLFPLMGVYFKQLGMNPAQVGILTGVRPFIEMLSAPFWNNLAERFQKCKVLLLFSLFSWIVFTYSLAHIRPPASACVAFNDTDYVLYTPYSNNDLANYDVGQENEGESIEPSTRQGAFLERMPTSSIVDNRENKDAILASEENQNDQGRRRRRKRNALPSTTTTGHWASDSYNVRSAYERPIVRPRTKKAYQYSLEDAEDNLFNSHLDLDVDLENDFDDTKVGINTDDESRDLHLDESDTPFFYLDSLNSVNSESVGDLHLDTTKNARYKRSYINDNNYATNTGEGDTDDQYPREEEDEMKNNGGAKKELQQDSGEQGDGEDLDVNNENDVGEPKREHDNVHHKQQASLPVASESSTIPSYQPNMNNQGVKQQDETGVETRVNKTKRVFKQRHKTPPTHIVGMSPITVEYAINYNKDKHKQFVTPMFSTIVYKLDDIKEVFFLLLLLISLGEFFSAPAITIADSITLSYLGENTDWYGRQRMFGSLSWAVTLLLVGMALDDSTSIHDHPCGPHKRERNYHVCFGIFSLLMACALITATQFKFSYLKGNGKRGPAVGHTLVANMKDDNTVVTTTTADTTQGNIDDLYASTQPRSIFNTAPPVNAPPQGSQQGKEKFEYLDKWKSAVFAQRTWELPEWVNVFRQFRNSLHLMYLFITWFLGCGVGLVFTFLFWHLQDVGGTPTLFGICSVINHISEVLAYFFSSNFIKRYGHTRVLSVGLGCNLIRFIYVAFQSNPYYALPFEFVQGITHAACFAACCSYMSNVSKPELRVSTQGVMQGLHHGIGRACGTLIGGYMINAIGSRASFCIYGLLSGCVLAGLLYVRKKAPASSEEEVKVDDSEALGGYGAPQGVPSAIPTKMAQTVAQQEMDTTW